MRSILILTIFLSFLFAISTVNAEIIAQWSFDDEDLLPEINNTPTANLSLSDNRTAKWINGNPPSGRALSVSGWNIPDRYLEISLDTVGYEEITFHFDAKSSSTGPSRFKIQYSSDGVNFIDLEGSDSQIAAQFTSSPMYHFGFSSVQEINNKPDVKFRIIVPEEGIGSSSTGTFAFDNIQIEGDRGEEILDNHQGLDVTITGVIVFKVLPRNLEFGLVQPGSQNNPALNGPIIFDITDSSTDVHVEVIEVISAPFNTGLKIDGSPALGKSWTISHLSPILTAIPTLDIPPQISPGNKLGTIVYTVTGLPE